MKKLELANATRRVTEADLLQEIADHISRGDTLDEVLASVVDAAVVLVGCDACIIYVRREGNLVPWVWKYVPGSAKEPSAVGMNDDLPAALAFHSAPLAVRMSEGVKFRVWEEWSDDPGETVVCVPLLSHSQLEGAITMQHRKPRVHRRRDIQLLSFIGRFVGADIGISQMEKENGELQLELETRKLVERGKGILQRDLGLCDHAAYLALQRESQRQQRPIGEIARSIILNSDLKANGRATRLDRGR